MRLLWVVWAHRSADAPIYRRSGSFPVRDFIRGLSGSIQAFVQLSRRTTEQVYLCNLNITNWNSELDFERANRVQGTYGKETTLECIACAIAIAATFMLNTNPRIYSCRYRKISVKKKLVEATATVGMAPQC